MHACIVVESHPAAVMGGAQYQSHLLAETLSRRPGVTVTYLARHAPVGAEAAKLPYRVRKIGHSAGIRRRAVAFDAPELWRALNELRPDVIYQRMKQSYSGVCALYARRAGIPFVFQAALDDDVGRHFVRRRWLTKNLPFDLVESFAGTWGVRHASHVIVQTEQQRRLLAENFGCESVQVIRNFQPLPASQPVKRESPVRVVWVANLKENKRPELFVELASAFASRADMEFIMVGREPQHWRLAGVMEAIKRQRNLSYLGELSVPNVNALLAESHIFVNTSRVEGFPNTFIQAWANGAVVTSITIDVDGGMDALGIGFCAGDLERLRSIVDRLSRSARERQAVAARAFEYVHREHSLRNAAKLADLLLRADDPPSEPRESHA